ncbi:hypothetical protein ACQ4PT_037493 [Festuca glaucescens]
MRPRLVLFGASITEQSFASGGWGAALAHHFRPPGVCDIYQMRSYGDYVLGTVPVTTQVAVHATSSVHSNKEYANLPCSDYQLLQSMQYQVTNQTPLVSSINSSYQNIHDQYTFTKQSTVGSNATALNHNGQETDMGEGLSYTQMLLGIDNISRNNFYNPFIQGPMSQENNLFKSNEIYGHLSGGNIDEAQASEKLVDEQGSFDSHFNSNMSDSRNNGGKQNSGDEQHFNDGQEDIYRTFGHQFCTNTNTSDNDTTNSNEGHLTEDELEDPAPKYHIFGDDEEESCDEIKDDDAQDPSSSNTGLPAEVVEHLSEQDILDFLDNEDAATTARTSSQEVRDHHTSHMGMQFDSDDAAHNFFNDYASICGFAIRKSRNYHAKKEGSSGHTRVTIQCNR